MLIDTAMPVSDVAIADDLPGRLVLGETPGRELAFGAVGKFWQPDIEWCRTVTTDPESRQRFLRYWWLVRPFVAHIMRASLRTIRADAETKGDR